MDQISLRQNHILPLFRHQNDVQRSFGGEMSFQPRLPCSIGLLIMINLGVLSRSIPLISWSLIPRVLSQARDARNR